METSDVEVCEWNKKQRHDYPSQSNRRQQTRQATHHPWLPEVVGDQSHRDQAIAAQVVSVVDVEVHVFDQPTTTSGQQPAVTQRANEHAQDDD